MPLVTDKNFRCIPRVWSQRGGFALVSVLILSAVVIFVALGLLSLSAVEIRHSQAQSHETVAKENARLALMIALGELQFHAGPDQRATAAAAILESSGETLPNRNWLGVWKTTFSDGSREWPVIGKAPSVGVNDTPYGLAGVYEDLRHTQSALAGRQWVDELHLGWLVSMRGDSVDVSTQLSPGDPSVVEIMGRGTLGDGMGDTEFRNNQILVQKVDVGPNGAFAWHISDESQKASIAPVPDARGEALSFEAAAQANPAWVRVGENQPFQDLNAAMQPHVGKFATYGSAGLAVDGPEVQQSLRSQRNHFTVDSAGLFTNPVTGGLKHDLTPLLLGSRNESSVDFDLSLGGRNYSFSSRLPIIPGQEHGVLGPSFDALRNWAQHAHDDLDVAETNFSVTSLRVRPTAHWAHGISDGVSADATRWAAEVPKIHPVMTDVRWHYYFSIHNNRIRTHIIPRVCLWNPYNREMTMPDLTILMPNPFFNISHGMHFFPEESHVDDLKTTSTHPITRWVKMGGYVGGDVYKMRVNPFPEQRYLAFTLEGATLGAGECHVFSPRISTPDLSASGINLQAFRPSEPDRNRLSSTAPQGADHFYYDHAPTLRYQIQAPTATGTTVDWRNLTESQVNEIDFGRIFDYQPEAVMSTSGRVENFPFILKAGTSGSLVSLYTSNSHPTLQLVHFGAGGANSTNYFAYIGESWGAANQQDSSFGFLESFADSPMKDAPVTHQVGAKLLWLDERGTEGNNPPLRFARWPINHMALNVAPVANWNVRAQLATRSPAAQVANRWYMTSAGAWFLQFVPYSPQNVNDQPTLSARGAFVKNPFGASVDFSFNPNVALFDLPSSGHGVISLARLRHAMLSPYSWTPSYIVGHSLRDLHAPSDRTKHPVAATGAIPGGFPTRWDFSLGASVGASSHGGRAAFSNSEGLLQIGSQAVTKSAAGHNFSSVNEVLAYDIAFEVNANLWDRFFLSSIPLAGDTQGLEWDLDAELMNPRYRFNDDGSLTRTEAESVLSAANSLQAGFFRSAELLHNSASFNVNSTSVPAWVAFLSSTLGKNRPLSSGESTGDGVSFSRYLNPVAIAETSQADPNSWGAWAGGRELSEDEVRILAESIVAEGKRRGPFLSLSDFINRRLGDRNDPSSHQGALDAAIAATGLNSNFSSDPIHLTTSLNRAGSSAEDRDNNHPDFQNGYRYQDADGQFTTTQPVSKAWGMPGFLTQSDLLESLAPALTTRGDTFVLRAYGESRDASGIKARAWVEAVVRRTPNYVDHRDAGVAGAAGNTPMDAALELDHGSGQLRAGDLNEVNRRLGRKFQIKSFRWLHPDEV